MTKSFIVIENAPESGVKSYNTWFLNGGLTSGFWENVSVQLFNNYPVNDLEAFMASLAKEGWRIENDWHIGSILSMAEKLVFLKYENNKLLVMRVLPCD